MRLIILLTFCIAPYLSRAQSPTFTILVNSIQIAHDTLSFRYELKNTTPTTFAFYNLKVASLEMNNYYDSLFMKKGLPRLLVDIIDKTDDYPKSFWGKRNRMVYSNYNETYNKRYILQPNEKLTFDIKLSLWGSRLHRGRYTLRFKYFSNSYYKEEFENDKSKDPSLSDCHYFFGMVKSNACVFDY